MELKKYFLNAFRFISVSLCGIKFYHVFYFRFFGFGKPIPTCKTPTVDVLEYYSGARGRGYLADTSEIEKDKIEMAQKYGYSIPELCDRVQQLAMESKNELQIFYGLQPGWIVNLADKEILKPVDPELQKLYNTNSVLV